MYAIGDGLELTTIDLIR